MQDMVGGDNNRTPVVFRDPDIYRIVGDERNRLRGSLFVALQGL